MIRKLLTTSIKFVPWRYRQRIKSWPVVAPVQRWIVNRLMTGTRFLHTIDSGPAKGLRIWIELPDDKALWTGTYEAEFAARLAAAVRPGDVCYDAGGYRGFFAGVCALAGAREVHIFEPLPANIERIESLIAANPELPLFLHRVALGNQDGETTFVIMPEQSMGKLASSSFQTTQSGSAAVQVKVCRLDEFIARDEISPPDLMKIDIEGAEAMMLEGACGVLNQSRPMLLIEVHSRDLLKSCCALLARFDYSMVVLETGRPPGIIDTAPEMSHLVATAGTRDA